MSWGVPRMGIPYLVSQMTSSQKNDPIVVAVIDTGVDSTHEYLRGKVLSGYDFINNDNDPYDDHNHGTHVAGTDCDVTNGLNIKILPVKVLAESGYGTNLLVASGIQYSVNNGAKVINLSLSSQSGTSSEYLDTVVSQAVANNVCVVVAAGNSSMDAAYFCPAHNSDAITVSAIDSYDNLASFSNYGNGIDVAAPGVGIYSCIPGGKYTSYDGTSMASPHIAGVCALLRAIYPNYSAKQIESVLKSNTDNIGSSVYYGYGVPHFTKTLSPDNDTQITTAETTTEAATYRERTTETATYSERTTEAATYSERTTETTTRRNNDFPYRQPTTEIPDNNYPYSGSSGLSLNISTNSYSQNGIGRAVIKITASDIPARLILDLDCNRSDIKLVKNGNIYEAVIEITQKGSHTAYITAYDSSGNVLSSSSSSFSF